MTVEKQIQTYVGQQNLYCFM